MNKMNDYHGLLFAVVKRCVLSLVLKVLRHSAALRFSGR